MTQLGGNHYSEIGFAFWDTVLVTLVKSCSHRFWFGFAQTWEQLNIVNHAGGFLFDCTLKQLSYFMKVSIFQEHGICLEIDCWRKNVFLLFKMKKRSKWFNFLFDILNICFISPQLEVFSVKNKIFGAEFPYEW